MKNNKLITFLLITTVIAVQIIGMFLPLAGDSGKYAAISKNIFLQKDFFNLTIHGSSYLQKPPVLMWLSSLGYFIFGAATNFTTRIFPLIFTLLMLYSTYRFARLFYGEKAGRLAATFLGTTLIYFFYNSDLHTDVILATSTTFTIWQLAEYIKNKKKLNFILAFIGAGVGMLSKGPLGAAVPFFAIGCHLIFTKNFRSIFRIEWLLGIAITIGVIMPYLYSIYNTFGKDGILFYFWTNNVGRISGEYRGNNSDPLFYLYNLIGFTVPWSVFFIGGIVDRIKDYIKGTKTAEFYTIGASFIFIVILSFSKMKSPNYFYPAIPLLSVIAGSYAVKTIKNEKLPIWIRGILNFQHLVIWGFIILVYAWVFPEKHLINYIISGIIFLFLVFISTRRWANSYKQITMTIISMVALMFTLNAQIFPSIFNYQSSIKAAAIINKEAHTDDNLFTYKYQQYGMFFYANLDGYRVNDHRSEEHNLIEFKDAIQQKNAWFFCDSEGLQEIKDSKVIIEKEYSFNNFYLTNMSIHFFNPQTRSEQIQQTHLVKINAK